MSYFGRASRQRPIPRSIGCVIVIHFQSCDLTRVNIRSMEPLQAPGAESGYVRDCKLRSMKLKIRHSDKYRGAARELRPNSAAQPGAKTLKQTARRNPRLSKPSAQTSTPGIGTLTFAFREATAAVRKNKVPLDVKKKKKKKIQ